MIRARRLNEATIRNEAEEIDFLISRLVKEQVALGRTLQRAGELFAPRQCKRDPNITIATLQVA